MAASSGSGLFPGGRLAVCRVGGSELLHLEGQETGSAGKLERSEQQDVAALCQDLEPNQNRWN